MKLKLKRRPSVKPVPEAVAGLGQAGARGGGWPGQQNRETDPSAHLLCNSCGHTWPCQLPDGPRGAVFGDAARFCGCSTPLQITPDGVTVTCLTVYCALSTRALISVGAPLPAGPPWPVAAPAWNRTQRRRDGAVTGSRGCPTQPQRAERHPHCSVPPR